MRGLLIAEASHCGGFSCCGGFSLRRLLIAGLLLLPSAGTQCMGFRSRSVWAQSLAMCGLSGMRASGVVEFSVPCIGGWLPIYSTTTEVPFFCCFHSTYRDPFFLLLLLLLPVLNSASAVVSSHCRALSWEGALMSPSSLTTLSYGCGPLGRAQRASARLRAARCLLASLCLLLR